MKLAFAVAALVAILWGLIALMGCGAANVAPAQDIAALGSQEEVCIDEADARAVADACRAQARARFCAKFPASCPSGWPRDGSTE